ncbi:hypothetical protein [Nonomuraea bangladeshensis]|uniref:hypothetical protein n=1 Tax=Nonomuraea bangladeshensis TaxID=404385 RepID=UPI0031D85A7C
MIAGTLVILGLGIRVAAFICTAAWRTPTSSSTSRKRCSRCRNDGEKTALFCWGFLLLAILGSGRWALSALRVPVRELAWPEAAENAT